MDTAHRTPLWSSALASGLLTIEQLQEAEGLVRAARAGDEAATPVNDETLGVKLVELGWLNRWQVEQLKVGRSRFNLKDYQVIDSIGQGGMGQVFKAEHTMMGRVVAIKVLPRHKSTPEAIASFTREMRAQAQLDHENLVRALDAGRDGNVYFLVTEYVPGTDLRKLVRNRGKLGMQEAATIMSQAASGLAHAHSRGMIHRDVKPGNLLVTPGGHTKVSDLGLAGFLGVEFGDDPRAGKIVGTADYLSPEQILTPRDITPAADIYSLGCTLYYAVTGKVPFPGGTTREKTRRQCEDTPINPRRLNPDLSEEFADVLAAMMEKDPKVRIHSANDVIERLAPWAAESILVGVEDVNVQPPLESDAPSANVANPLLSKRRQELPDTVDPALPIAPVLNDTEAGFFDEMLAAPAENPSDAAEGTDPVAAAIEETRSDLARRSKKPGKAAMLDDVVEDEEEDESALEGRDSQPALVVSESTAVLLMLPFILAAAVLVVSVLLKTIR